MVTARIYESPCSQLFNENKPGIFKATCEYLHVHVYESWARSQKFVGGGKRIQPCLTSTMPDILINIVIILMM